MKGDILARLSKAVSPSEGDEAIEEFMTVVISMMQAKTEEEIHDAQERLPLTAAAAQHPALIDYMRAEWYPYMRAWSDVFRNAHLHYGWETTNAVEGTQSALKSNLKWSSRPPVEFVKSITQMWKRKYSDYTQMHAEQSRLPLIRLKRTGNLFEELKNIIARRPLEIMLDEYDKYAVAAATGIPLRACTRYYERCHGLLCSHKIKEYMEKGAPVPAAMISSKHFVTRPMGLSTWSGGSHMQRPTTRAEGCLKVGRGRLESLYEKELRVRVAAQKRLVEEEAARRRVAKDVARATELEARAAAKAAAKENLRLEGLQRSICTHCMHNQLPTNDNMILCNTCRQWYHWECELFRPQKSSKRYLSSVVYTCRSCDCRSGFHVGVESCTFCKKKL